MPANMPHSWNLRALWTPDSSRGAAFIRNAPRPLVFRSFFFPRAESMASIHPLERRFSTVSHGVGDVLHFFLFCIVVWSLRTRSRDWLIKRRGVVWCAEGDKGEVFDFFRGICTRCSWKGSLIREILIERKLESLLRVRVPWRWGILMEGNRLLVARVVHVRFGCVKGIVKLDFCSWGVRRCISLDISQFLSL